MEIGVKIFMNTNNSKDQLLLKGLTKQNKNKQTPWPLVRKRTIPTERTPLVDEF
jgi:hypothetical protein